MDRTHLGWRLHPPKEVSDKMKNKLLTILAPVGILVNK